MSIAFSFASSFLEYQNMVLGHWNTIDCFSGVAVKMIMRDMIQAVPIMMDTWIFVKRALGFEQNQNVRTNHVRERVSEKVI